MIRAPDYASDATDHAATHVSKQRSGGNCPLVNFQGGDSPLARSIRLCGNIIQSRDSPMPRINAPNHIDKHVGSRIRIRRMMLDMNQTKLGDALGITFQQVHKHETGENRIGASRLHHIAQILQVPVAFFFEDDMPASGDPKHMIASPNTIMDFMSTSEGSALAKAFMRIRSTPLRRRILELVEGIVGRQLH
jgi:transcriptional regulator with XRE-family HTH domain